MNLSSEASLGKLINHDKIRGVSVVRRHRPRLGFDDCCVVTFSWNVSITKQPDISRFSASPMKQQSRQLCCRETQD